MPRRITPFETGNYYHVFNRGVNKFDTFIDDRDRNQALFSMDYYRISKPPVKYSRLKSLSENDRTRILAEVLSSHDTLVDILCFTLMPNHFHFLLKQNQENGISKFISQFTNSYTKYFNTAHARTGHLFQGQFKAVEIESESQLIHVSRYIHLNPYVSNIITKQELSNYRWSSYPQYLSSNPKLINPSLIIGIFKSPKKYEEFVLNHADYAKELEYIKHLTIDTE